MADDRVKRIKEANDIVAVVGAYLPLRPSGETFKGLCPFHDDHRPSFDVNPNRQRYRCWSCGKYGDVISFVQEHERIDFRGALELLARRAGIVFENGADSPHGRSRALMLDTVRWAAQQFHECLLSSPLAIEARRYLDQRGLEDETVRAWGLGFAPLSGEWLTRRAEEGGVDLELLNAVGLISERKQGPGYFDRFRDRVQFPIRDVQGRTVGFGGRILPNSPLIERGPKYKNTAETELFRKSELLYGLDQARSAIGEAGYVAVVEGYTDVLMAHQHGVAHVIATMGTALNARHVRQLRRFAPRVVLVFDADAGGITGVDRALEVFASEEIDLAIATLPEGLDPCDLLHRDGPEAFCAVLDRAVDALEFKINRVLVQENNGSIEGQRRAVDEVLGVIARAPCLTDVPGADRADVKTQLMVSRIARRLNLKEETVWARLDELRKEQRGVPAKGHSRSDEAESEGPAPTKARALPEERELLEIVLADETLVPEVRCEVALEEIEHPGLRRLLAGLFALLDAELTPTLDRLRERLEAGPLSDYALRLQDAGSRHGDKRAWLDRVIAKFRERRARPVKQDLLNKLHATRDDESALDLLRQLQKQTVARP